MEAGPLPHIFPYLLSCHWSRQLLTLSTLHNSHSHQHRLHIQVYPHTLLHTLTLTFTTIGVENSGKSFTSLEELLNITGINTPEGSRPDNGVSSLTKIAQAVENRQNGNTHTHTHSPSNQCFLTFIHTYTFRCTRRATTCCQEASIGGTLTHKPTQCHHCLSTAQKAVSWHPSSQPYTNNQQFYCSTSSFIDHPNTFNYLHSIAKHLHFTSWELSTSYYLTSWTHHSHCNTFSHPPYLSYREQVFLTSAGPIVQALPVHGRHRGNG